MKIRISHGAYSFGQEDWFVVHPLEGSKHDNGFGTNITHEDAVRSLLEAGRPVYELEVPGAVHRHTVPVPPFSGSWRRITLEDLIS